MRPLIGIPCHAGIRSAIAAPGQAGAQIKVNPPIYYNNTSYIHMVEHAGGVPILIPIYDDLSELNALLPRLDGLLLSGGIDIHPQYYGEEAHPLLGVTNPQLDELELTLARWALQEEMPTLGICRGMQLLNVALGGNLYQDLSDQHPSTIKHSNWDLPRDQIVHTVKVEAGSQIEKILGVREVPANSLHHQAAKEAGAGVYISGYADDGVAEMLEVPGHHFMIAVQCHPEELYREYPVWSRLLEAFIAACTRSASAYAFPIGVSA